MRYIFRRVRTFSAVSLGFLLFLTAASGIFVYQVSPLRDPASQFNSTNTGSLRPWMQGVQENHWLRGASILAALLAANLTLILWQGRQLLPTTAD